MVILLGGDLFGNLEGAAESCSLPPGARPFQLRPRTPLGRPSIHLLKVPSGFVVCWRGGCRWDRFKRGAGKCESLGLYECWNSGRKR